MNDEASAPLPEALAAALKACLETPDNDEAWDNVEELAAEHQLPDDVAAAYATAIAGDIEIDLAERLGRRAVRFHDEWFSESGPLIKILTRLLEIDPGVGWAFERVSLLLTVAERWDEMLALYDRALAATNDKMRRRELLDEAAHVAKDFAGQPDRAIRYLEQLYPLKPSDAQLAASLERLLETRGRYRDLIQLWSTRLTVLPHDAAQATRARIAACWLDHLASPAEALEAALPLLEPGGSEEANACELLERIAALPDAPADTRKRALSLVKDRYAAAGRSDDVIRVLKRTLTLAEPEEQIAAHREIAGRLSAQGRAAEAMEHEAAIVVLDPLDRAAIAGLRELAERTGSHATHADALSAAAEASTDKKWSVELLYEAATVRCDRVGDDAGGAALFMRAFSAPEAEPAIVMAVGRRLAGLFEKMEKSRDLVDVLDRLAGLVEDADERRSLLGRVARLSDELGDLSRSLGAWERRLEADASDMEALDALIDVLGRTDRWEPLVDALKRRAVASSDDEPARDDLVRIASIVADKIKDVDRAIQAWREVEERFGRSAQTVDALADLLGSAGRWDELATLLHTSIQGEAPGARRASLLGRLGDAYRQRLDAATNALQCYSAALEEEPQNAQAREGLTALVGDASCASGAISALVRAFRRTDEWWETLALLEQRLRVAEDDQARAEILMEAAATQETRGNDANAALLSVGRALAFAPESARIEQDLVRLAEKSGGWSATVDAYRRAISSAEGDDARVAELRFRQGSILEEKLDDLEGALEAYTLVRDAIPARADAADAVARVASRLGRWDSVAQALVVAASAMGAVRSELFDIIEGTISDPAAWDEATRVIEGTVESADLTSAAAHALETRIGVWHRDRRKDAAAAERSLLRAASRESSSAETLRMLAELQRRAPGRPLVDTLLKLAAADADDLDSLHEAAEVALDVAGDQELARPILARLFNEASERWRSGQKTGENHEPEALVSWALDRLVRVHELAEEFARAVQLLVDGARLPFSRARSHGLYHRAAELAALRMKDSELAISLYRTLVAEEPSDEKAIAELAALYDANGRLGDLIELRKHELSLASDTARRLALRLDIARAFAALGDAEGRIQALRENLAEEAGHEASVASLSEALEGSSRYRDLSTMLADQASTLEQRGAGDAAQGLWMRVAQVAERHLEDVDLALSAYGRAVKLGGTAEALDALARLHTDRGEHAAAVGWLEQRLDTSAPEDRTSVVLRLADALVGAGKSDRARARLEGALSADPSAKEVRSRLANIYRSLEAWEPLVKLLLEGAEHEGDTQARLALLGEAAEIQLRRLGTPGDAVSTLQTASALAPQDKNIRAALCDALRGAGRLDEAKAILEGLVEEFGRRRPPARAALHFQLAQVAQARGDMNEALRQLDLASDMNMGHAGVLQLLGNLAHEAGQLERAERAYRALLLIVRRQKPGEAAASGGPVQSEVLLSLYRLSQSLGQVDRAKELLESAFEIAAQSDEEAVRFERALRALGDNELLLRSLEARLARADRAEGQAAVLSEIAGLLEEQGRPDDALDMRLRAVAQAPDAIGVQRAARALATRIGAMDRYLARLEELAAQAQSDGQARLASELLLQIGEIAEVDLKDLARALAAYQRAEDLGEKLVETWRSIERLSGSLGDKANQARALRKLVEAEGGLPPEDQAEALYRLAELELSQPETREQGASTLSWALDRDPQHERAAAMLRAAAESSSDQGVIELYERVARASGSAPMLLDALTRLTALPGAGPDAVREAVDIAVSLGEHERAEALLHRAVEQAGGSDEGAVWALIALAERRKAARDFSGAVAWMRRAAKVADAGESFQLSLEIASLAASEMNDLALAAATYEDLLQRDPSDRAVWEPLLDVYRRQQDDTKLAALIASTVDSVLDGGDRRRLRMERAKLLLRSEGGVNDAIAVLQEILSEEPDDADAADLLLGVLEKTGRADDLADLLARQLDGARGRGDGLAIAALSLRLASLLAKTRREDAIDALKSALEHVPDDRRILQELLALYRPDDDAGDRANVMERLLSFETGERAAALAIELADLWASVPDHDGALRALSRGAALAPESAELRARLLRWYWEHERFAELATMILEDAERALDPKTAVQRLREAASIYETRLSDPAQAADALRKARALAPRDVELVRDLAQALTSAGEPSAAIEEVTSALDGRPHNDTTRAELFRIRADLHVRQGDDAAAVLDLDQALSLGDVSAMPALLVALEQQRAGAAGRGDFTGERAATLRLVELLSKEGDGERSRELLSSWVARNPQDAAALRLLLAIDTTAERWREVAETCNRLIEVEDGDARVEVALKLADACTKAGAPMAARIGLERVFQSSPGSAQLRAELRKLYEQIGAHREHAGLYMREAESAADDASRFEPLKRAGELLMVSAKDAEAAIEPLEGALRIRSGDHETTILLADAYTSTGRLEDATNLINTAIAGQKKGRSRESAVLQHRMARVAAAAGDRSVEMAWLGVAFDADMQNGQIAAELADVAMELGENEMALKALRAVTMMKNPAPMGRAMAYLRQGMIAHRQGDTRRAAILAKKAQTEDPELVEAREFLAQIGAG